VDRAALLEAFALVEAVQGEDAAAALAAVDEALARVDDVDARFVLETARTAHAVVRGGTPDIPRLLELAPDDTATAVALGLQALAAGNVVGLLSSTSHAIARLDMAPPGPLRCLGLVIVAAGLNTLRLWELVDELYSRAVFDAGAAQDARQDEAVAINRILIGLEHGVTLLECDDVPAAEARLRATAALVPDALAVGLRPLWHRNALAAADLVALLLDEPLSAPVDEHVAELSAAGDVEVLPLLLAAAALHSWRRDRDPEPAHQLVVETSATSSAHTFPAWVRAVVLSESIGGDAMEAVRHHSRLLAQALWASRSAVLAAARTQIDTERRRLEHERLARAVNTDPLTGLHNRRRFDDWLDRPGGGPVALLLLDLDGFKAINDQHGHGVGDEVLRRLGLLLRTAVRPGDLAVRQGGDEFALVLRDDDLVPDAVLTRAAEVAKSVAGEDWSSVSPGLSVEVSIGAALATGDASGPALYSAADAALYRAKRESRAPVLEVL